jgi:sulfide:quinone oxidoreductase
MRDYIPDGVTWIRDRVAGFDPDHSRVTLAGGDVITYDQLIVALGIQLDWGKIEGLAGHLGKDGLCSNYSYDHVASTWEGLQTLREGNAVFTFPNTPIKCAGAPQKIMYLADELAAARRNVRAKPLTRHLRQRRPPASSAWTATPSVPAQGGGEVRASTRCSATSWWRCAASEKKAVFKSPRQGTEVIVVDYELLHVVPPQMSAPDFLKPGPAGANAAGLGRRAQVHAPARAVPQRVWSLGDCLQPPHLAHGRGCPQAGPGARGEPASRTAPASRSRAAIDDGTRACPLVTGYGKLIMAEFDYDGQPAGELPVRPVAGAVLDVRVQGVRAARPLLEWDVAREGLTRSAGVRHRSVTSGPREHNRRAP